MNTLRRLLDSLVIAIDDFQRKRLGIWEVSDDPECILRLGLTTSYMGARLADGTVVQPGERIGLIHFANERVPTAPPGGPDLAWAREFMRRMTTSLRLLTRHLVENPDMAGIRAFGGELPFVYTTSSTRFLERLGLEVFDPLPPGGLLARVVDMGARLWTLLLRRAFNPDSAPGLRLNDLERRPVWLSRQTLIALYAPDCHSAAADEEAIPVTSPLSAKESYS